MDFRKAEGLLKPGTWRVGAPRNPTRRTVEAIAVRKGAEVPDHIFASAFQNSGAASAADLIWNEVEVTESAARMTDFQADVWLPRHSSKWLLFDLERSEVMRWASSPYSVEYLELRKAFERHVVSVSFKVMPSDGVLIESLPSGRALSEFNKAMQTAIARQLLRGLAALIRETGVAQITERDSDSLAAIVERSPLVAVRECASDLLEMFGHDTPLVPTHDDLAPNNVIVEEDGVATVIDFGRLHLGPFWLDPLTIAAQNLEVWSAGGFDEELGAIWEAAGWERVSWNRSNVGLAVTHLAARRVDSVLSVIGAVREKRDWRIARAKGLRNSLRRVRLHVRFWKKFIRQHSKISSQRKILADMLRSLAVNS